MGQDDEKQPPASRRFSGKTRYQFKRNRDNSSSPDGESGSSNSNGANGDAGPVQNGSSTDFPQLEAPHTPPRNTTSVQDKQRSPQRHSPDRPPRPVRSPGKQVNDSGASNDMLEAPQTPPTPSRFISQKQRGRESSRRLKSSPGAVSSRSIEHPKSASNPRRAGNPTAPDDDGVGYLLDSDEESEEQVGAVAVFSNGVSVTRPSLSLPSNHTSLRVGVDGDDPVYGPDGQGESIGPTLSVVQASPLTAEVELDNSALDLEQAREAVGPPPVDGKEDDNEATPWYKRKVAIILMIAVALAVIVGVAVGVTLSQKNDDGGAPPNNGGDGALSSPPTPSPIVLDPIKVQAVQQHIIDTEISDEEALSNQQSPQYQAYMWLVTMDTLTEFSDNMNSQQVAIMTTRYILAVVYYALEGGDWHSAVGWLHSGLSHCDWEYIDCADDEDQTVLMFRTRNTVETASNGNGNENMRGALPPEFAHLSKLERLQLPGNSITDISPIATLRNMSKSWLQLAMIILSSGILSLTSCFLCQKLLISETTHSRTTKRS